MKKRDVKIQGREEWEGAREEGREGKQQAG